jgi:hypothetical protein
MRLRPHASFQRQTMATYAEHFQPHYAHVRNHKTQAVASCCTIYGNTYSRAYTELHTTSDTRSAHMPAISVYMCKIGMASWHLHRRLRHEDIASLPQTGDWQQQYINTPLELNYHWELNLSTCAVLHNKLVTGQRRVTVMS